MELRTLSLRFTLAGTLLIWAVKFFLRPYVDMNGPLQFMAGIAPNLIGSFLVPFAAYWLYTHPRFFNGQLLRFYFFSDNRIVCLTGFVLALVNEYIQLIPVFGRTFDYYDILFSALGLLLAFYSFCFVKKRALVQTLPQEL